MIIYFCSKLLINSSTILLFFFIPLQHYLSLSLQYQLKITLSTFHTLLSFQPPITRPASYNIPILFVFFPLQVFIATNSLRLAFIFLAFLVQNDIIWLTFVAAFIWPFLLFSFAFYDQLKSLFLYLRYLHLNLSYLVDFEPIEGLALGYFSEHQLLIWALGHLIFTVHPS